ncbi:MAG: nucleotidyltransferase domain-containing protein [Armatimonadota bacterium]
MQPDQQKLDELVRRVVEAVHPLKIIVFGSAARGEMGPDSDVDLLVVMPEGTHRGQTADRTYLSVRRVGIPSDVVVGEDYERGLRVAEAVVHWAEEEAVREAQA